MSGEIRVRSHAMSTRMRIRVTAAIGAVIVASVAAMPAEAANRPITDQQAVSFLKGKASLPAISGGKTQPLPKSQRAYAVRAYRSGPYGPPALNLFYAVGATAAHYMSNADKKNMGAALMLLGRDGLADQIAQSIKHPETVTRFGVTVRQFATAATRGIVAGFLD